MRDSLTSAIWHVYMIENRLDQLYTGVTTDPLRRLRQHQSGTGAKALKGKGPLKMVFCAQLPSQRQALQAEHWIKQCQRKEKLRIIRGESAIPHPHQDCLSSVLAELARLS